MEAHSAPERGTRNCLMSLLRGIDRWLAATHGGT
jgi:hypothetical protein